MQCSRRCDYFVVRTRFGSYLYCPFKKNPSSLMLCMKKEVSLLYNFSLCVAPALKEIVLASQELRENVKYNLTGGEVVYVSLPCPTPLLPSPSPHPPPQNNAFSRIFGGLLAFSRYFRATTTRLLTLWSKR